MQSTVRICPQCGLENPSWRIFCQTCRASLAGATLVERTVESAEPTVPVRLEVEYPERLSRLLLFVKWLFVIPLYIGLGFYGIAAIVVTFLAFWAILFTGRYPEGMFNFVKGYIEFQFKVYAYFPLLMTDSWFPDEVRYEVDYPDRLSRLVLVFLKLPSFLLSIVPNLFGLVLSFLFWITIPVWFVILLLGKYPRRLFDFNVRLLEWVARVTAWQWLMRDNRSLFGTTRLVQIIVIIGLVVMLTSSAIAYTPLIPATSPLALWLGGIGYGGQGEAVVTQFMEAGRDSDIEAAAEFLSDPAAEVTDLENFILQNRNLFEGFESAQCTRWKYFKYVGQPAVLQLQGELNYRSDPKGTFECDLVKLEDIWKIDSLWLDRPPQ